MIIVTAAGNLGADAQYKETQNGKGYCSFSLAATVGYGDKKQTMWLDVTRWGEGAQGLAKLLRKGSKVTVTGELSSRDHNGKTYLQCRADHVALQGDRAQPDAGSSEPSNMHGGNLADDDLDSEIPF